MRGFIRQLGEEARLTRELMDDGFRDADVSVRERNVRGEHPVGGTGTSAAGTGLAGTSAAAGMSGVTGTGTAADYGDAQRGHRGHADDGWRRLAWRARWRLQTVFSKSSCDSRMRCTLALTCSRLSLSIFKLCINRTT